MVFTLSLQISLDQIFVVFFLFLITVFQANVHFLFPIKTLVWGILAYIYLFKVNNKNTRKSCEICLKLTIKTPERRQ